MKKNLFSNHALCAGLVLGGLFTFSSSYAANNEVKDNNNVVAAAPTTNSQIVGTWELTNKGSYAIVRNPRTHKEYKVGFTIDRYDDYKFLPVDFATGEPVNLRTLVGHDDNDLDAKLPSAEGKNMFAYWKPLLTDLLIEAVHADDGILVHLATEEFQHLFDWKRLQKEVRIIQPLFMVDQGSRLKAVSVYAKSCRGAMTSYILRNQLTSPDELLTFEYDGFTYHKDYGDEDHPHFILKS